MGKRMLTLVFLTALIAVAIGGAPAQSQSFSPLKLAVFDIELDDFTAGGPIAGESPRKPHAFRR